MSLEVISKMQAIVQKKPSKTISKPSMAAFKAWKTRRVMKATKFVGKKIEKKNGKVQSKPKKPIEKPVVKTIGRDVAGIEKQKAVHEAEFKAIEAKQMRQLNGIDQAKMAKATQKHMDRKEVIERVKNGRAEELRAIIVKAKPKKSKAEVAKKKRSRK